MVLILTRFVVSTKIKKQKREDKMKEFESNGNKKSRAEIETLKAEFIKSIIEKYDIKSQTDFLTAYLQEYDTCADKELFSSNPKQNTVSQWFKKYEIQKNSKGIYAISGKRTNSYDENQLFIQANCWRLKIKNSTTRIRLWTVPTLESAIAKIIYDKFNDKVPLCVYTGYGCLYVISNEDGIKEIKQYICYNELQVKGFAKK